MINDISLKQARSVAFKMLAARARTSAQILQALKRKGATEELAAEVIEELLSAGYLNDREFTINYIAARLEQKPCGPLYLLAKLNAAGICRSLAQEVLAENYPYERQKEEALRLARLLRERGETCPQKAMRKLANRGFTGATIRPAVEEEFFAYLDITQ
jgi:regulatory protein